jgi:hypothetical protein
MKSLKAETMALALAAPGMAFAATDGSLGATSTGTINVSATVAAPERQVQLKFLDDIAFGDISNASVGSNLSSGDIFCITSTESATNSNARVRLSLSQDNTGGFALISGTDTLPFTVQLSAGASAINNFGSMTDSASAFIENLPASDSLCNNSADIASGFNKMFFSLTLPIPANMATGSYSATLNVLAAPQ